MQHRFDPSFLSPLFLFAPSFLRRRVRACGRMVYARLAAAPLAALIPVLILFIGMQSAQTLHAQTLNDRMSAKAQKNTPTPMLVEANEMLVDRDRDRVSAVGKAVLRYDGRVLEAERVVYDKKTKRVHAEGQVRITEADGTLSFGERFELTDDFKQGFIDSLRIRTPQNTRFSAARAERVEGDVLVLERGTFTPCEPCRDDPEKPPLWQMKARRIIHNNTEQRIYYEDATLEFWGTPVAYIPYFSSPDPSVERASGILTPKIFSKNKLGYGFSLPIYWAASPAYDLTVTPSYLSRQGVHGDVQWRHRFSSGQYTLRANGIAQQDGSAFPSESYLGAGSRTFRGSLNTTGDFRLNKFWTFGWNGTVATDKFYFSDYRIAQMQGATSTYFSEMVSSAYLRGQGNKSWVDLSVYHFLGLSTHDWQPQIGTALPSLDYDRRFTPDKIGGELRVTANAAIINREAAFYQPLDPTNPGFSPTRLIYGPGEGYYSACATAAGGAYRPGDCLLRGVAGQYARTSLDIGWKRRFIDPLGQEWTPFIGMRGDLAWLNLNKTGYNNPADIFGSGQYGNNQQNNFFTGNSDNYLARTMPRIGLEYRYPFIAQSAFGTHHLEPIAQIIARPNETRIGNLPNEDSQSLVFDDTNLFALNKFSGYDRIEGGTRVNYGLRYALRLNNGAMGTLLFGQSRQLSGRNSFAQYDLANTGLDSGLQHKRSDYIASASFEPSSRAHFSIRTRLDENNLRPNRIDIEARGQLTARVSINALYTRIASQPNLGYNLRREGLYLGTHVSLPKNTYIFGSALFDLDRYLLRRTGSPGGGDIAAPIGLALGLGYKDECTDLSLSYSRLTSGYQQSNTRKDTAVVLRLELKDLGDVSLSQRSSQQ